MDREAIIRRIDELQGLDFTSEGGDRANNISEAYQGALTLLAMVHGPACLPIESLKAADRQARERQANLGMMLHQYALPTIRGALRNLRAEVEAGLIGSMERQGLGAALSDFLGLAKDALADGTEGSRNVAAVLAAAAFEDTIRRMGESLAGVSSRPDLSDVLTALKNAGLLQGASVATAQGYLKFRNDALHADWSKIDRAVVGSCIAFVEGLLMKHFS